MIKTRFAPSPTGELHIGSARTALFVYLMAKHEKGQFLLRIEDTDRERYVEGSVERIIESLEWLGIVPDNIKKPMVQSERLDIYKKYALQLLNENKAYICTCSKERLAELRKEQETKKLPTGYDGKCRSIKYEVQSIEQLEEQLGKGAVVRMRMPKDRKIKFNDLIRGEVEFDSNLLDDQVILKSDGYPTYHLANIIDDHEMEITDVIRAEEWLSSTPKHIILYEMFGWKAPRFAHLSMILGTDKKKLSKRHGATSIVDYKKAGYLPEAIVNFIVFMGWNPKDEREIFSLEELEKEFDIRNVNKAAAIFNIEKLDNINEQYIKDQISSVSAGPSPDGKITHLRQGYGGQEDYLVDFGVKNITKGEIELLGRGGFKTLREMADEILELRKKPDYEAKLLIFKKSNKENTLKGLELALEELKDIDGKEWNDQELQMKLSLVVTRNDLTNGDVFWPVRVALSGKEKSPSPIELLIALGKEESLTRVKSAIKVLSI